MSRYQDESLSPSISDISNQVPRISRFRSQGSTKALPVKDIDTPKPPPLKPCLIAGLLDFAFGGVWGVLGLSTLHGRTPMSRKQRVFIPNAVYHVYCRVARGEFVFGNDVEAENWVSTVHDVAATHELSVFAWCLLSNHYHLVLRSGPSPIWKAMARIQGRTAKHHNRRRRVLGRLWQSRYKAKIVLDQKYLEQLLAYVHLNPVAAGIVDDPAAYRWSGHRALIGQDDPLLVDVAEALLIYDPVPGLARPAYLRYLRAVAEARWLQDGVRRLPWWQPVSDDEQTIEEPDAPPHAVTFDEKPLPPLPPKAILVPDLLHRYEESRSLPRGSMKARTKTSMGAHHRRVFTLLAVEHMNHSSKEVATHLSKSPNSVSRWLAEALVLMTTSTCFREEVMEALRNLRMSVKPDVAAAQK